MQQSVMGWGTECRCTPESLSAFRENLLQVVPDPDRSNEEVAEVIVNDPWLLGMIQICAVKRWRRYGQPAGVLDDLRSEALCVIAERCLRNRAHGFDIAQADHVSGFWTTVVSRAVYQAWSSVCPWEIQVTANLEHVPGPEAEEESPIDADQLLQAIFSLPDREKAVMTLRAMRGLNLHAIAHELGLSYDQVRYSNQSAMRQLRRMLSERPASAGCGILR